MLSVHDALDPSHRMRPGYHHLDETSIIIGRLVPYLKYLTRRYFMPVDALFGEPLSNVPELRGYRLGL